MTAIELAIWIGAYTRNQPAPGGTVAAIYWAACAVYAFRGALEPTAQQAHDMLAQVRTASALQPKQVL